MPRSLTPVGQLGLTKPAKLLLPSGFPTPSASTRTVLSRLDHAAYVYAVYALCRESPHATQDSLPVCGLGFNGAGVPPAGLLS